MNNESTPEAFMALDAMNQQDENPQNISISPGALKKKEATQANKPYRGRGQSARHWVDRNEIHPDENGFLENDQGELVLSTEYNDPSAPLTSFNETHPDELSFNATLSGVQSVTQELYERDLVSVETPKMDRSGVQGNIKITVDDRITDYIEDVSGEFSDNEYNANASAAVAVALNSIQTAIEESYDGDVKMKPTPARHSISENMDKTLIDEDHFRDENELDYEINSATFLNKLGGAAVNLYRENKQAASYQENDSESTTASLDQKEESEGFFSKFL